MNPGDLDPKTLYEMLRCPKDRGELQVHVSGDSKTGRDRGCLLNPRLGWVWTVADGIPRFVGEGNVDLEIDIEILRELKAEFPSVPKSAIDETVAQLTKWKTSDSEGWERDEMTFWEQYYADKLEQGSGDWAVTNNRLIPRQQHILRRLPDDVENVLEIGCGTSGTLWSDRAFISNRTYFGTDLSFNALRVARSRLPGYYVLCDVNAMPFMHDSIDAILGFGILHHLSNHEEAIRTLAPILRSGGWYGFTEKLKTSDKVRNSKLVGLAKRLVLKKERDHGEQEFIDGDNLLKILDEVCGGQRTIHYDYSVARDVLVKITLDILRINHPIPTKINIAIDNLCVKFFSPVCDLLKPKNAMFVARKL